jgi:hypothetical protein
VKELFFSVLFFSVLFISCVSSDSEKEVSQEQNQPRLPLIEVNAQTDRTTATIAQPIIYTLSALYDPEIKIQLPEVGSQIAGLRIVDFGEEGPKEIDHFLELKKWYKLRADIVGTYIIPSMNVSYKDKDTQIKELKTPQIFIKIDSVLKDEKGKASTDIIDIKPLQELERDLTLYILFVIGALFLIMGLVGALLYINKKQKSLHKFLKPAHVLALEAFEKLKKEKLIEKGIVREHYFRLSDIFRRYIENRFAIPAVEQTTQELLPELWKLEGLTPPIKSKAKEFLVHSDLIKFAKYSPPQNEIENSHENLLKVIDETKQEEEKKT